MLTHNDTVRLLALAAAYDQRTVGEEDVDAWRFASQVGRWTPAGARRVVVEHYSRDAGRPRLTPAMVTDALRTVRGRAAESFEAPRLPDGLPAGQYPRWLRAQLAAHCDGILERWATLGEEPPNARPAPAVRIRSVEELGAAAPAEHRTAIAAGLEAMDDRSAS